MRKTYSVAFKKAMVAKLIGKYGTSANRLAQETGVSQTSLSLWRRQARSLPEVSADRRRTRRTWTLERKVEILAATAKLQGEELAAYLVREGMTLVELDKWRTALHEDSGSIAATKRIRKLERELARKEKALAEAAALLILKKKLEDHFGEDEDEDTDEETDK
jgi:transposase-like protein